MKDKFDSSRANGEKVWTAMQSQLAEAGGFLGAMLRSAVSFVRRYMISLFVFAALGGGIASVIWLLKPDYYQADMTVSYVHYEKKIYADMLEKIYIFNTPKKPLLTNNIITQNQKKRKNWL